MNEFTESFSTYSTVNQLDGKWQGGRTGGTVHVGAAYAISAAAQGLECNAGGTIAFLPAVNERFVGARVKFVSGGSGHADFIALQDNTTPQISIYRNASGTLALRRNGTTVVTSTLTVALGVIYYIELRLKANTSGGITTVWVDGVQYATFTGNTQATANAYSNRLQINAGGGGGNIIWYGDIYSNDTTGTVNTGREGDTVITPLKVSGAGTFAQFSRGGVDTGSNQGQLNKALADPASFTVDNVLNHRDSFAMAALGTGTIKGARLWVHAKKDSVGSRSFALTVESGATDDIGADQSLAGGGFLWFSRDMAKDPATAALWANLAALNAAKSGYKITV